MNAEKLRYHLKYLQEYHDELDQQITEDYEKHKDDRLVSVMKKKKLALRDEIESVTRQLAEIDLKIS